MRQPLACILVALAVLFVQGGMVAHVDAASYTFTLIADSTSFFQPNSFIAPFINNAGKVAFYGTVMSGELGVFTGDGGSITTLYDTSSQFSNITGDTPINDTGTVAFGATLDTGGVGVFAGDGGTPILIADFGSVPDAIPETDSINLNGLVGVRVIVGQFDYRMLVGDGGPPITIVDSSGPFTSFSAPILNNTGTAVFKGFLDTGEEGIFAWNNGMINTLVDSNGPLSDFPPPSINNHGVVVFAARLDTGGSGIFTWNNGTIKTIADTSGFFEAFGTSHINDTGTVVFAAARGGVVGIYTGPDPVADKVIVEGDPLFGSQVVDIDIFKALNNVGQIAFWAMLADGRQAIVRANPVVDMTPPVITVAANPSTLSPPSGKLVSVTVSGTIVDDEPDDLGVEAGSTVYRVIDEYGQIQPSGSFPLDADGEYTFTVALQAARNGSDKNGRRYTIEVSATDNAGNSGTESAIVTVPRK